VSSSPVVPGDDPTLLFTNAGMNQFKDVFLGFDKRPYSRATTAQKCIRAGGKHNDLDNVGYTARHHTFFEMLGNFSFGDYFKHDAISYAWELLTQHFKLPADKLWVTVYSEDDEAYEIWNKVVGVPAERIVRIGDNKGGRYMSDNFWMMGDTGPCGPCTEIFYDHGPDVAGGPRAAPMKTATATSRSGTTCSCSSTAPKTVRCTAAQALGGHRHGPGAHCRGAAACALELRDRPLRRADRRVQGGGERRRRRHRPGFAQLKVIADHIRACSFTIVDGVIPGNEGRGYVLRRIARRAIRHGYKLGARTPFFHKIVAELVNQMGEAYPELRQAQARVTEVLQQEEERFFQTIERGMEILEGALAAMEAAGAKQLDGETAFKLHDTYGFPWT
jgi:alanyl-tRNA synthetase